MKTFLLKVFLMLVAFAFGATMLSAQDFTYSDLEYSINYDDVTVTVTGHVDGYEATGTLNIPTVAYYNGNPYTVTIIDSYAFAYCTGLTGALVLPNTIKEIGDDAFYFCSTLSGELVIPEQITSIGAYAFEGCTGLTGSLVIPNTVNQLGESAFANCTGFDGTLTLSEALPNIQNWTFEGCQGFTGSLVIPNSVRTIGSSAFEDCRSFDGSLTLPEKLASVGSFAFASCSGFKDVIILSETPPELGNYPFGGFGSTTLVVPCGCVSAYENAAWHEQFTNIIEDCTAVAEAEDQSAKVYPNPTQGCVTIEAENIQHIAIFNLIGENVFESVTHCDAVSYDFSGFEKGLYLIRIETKNDILTKFVTVM